MYIIDFKMRYIINHKSQTIDWLRVNRNPLSDGSVVLVLVLNSVNYEQQSGRMNTVTEHYVRGLESIGYSVITVNFDCYTCLSRTEERKEILKRKLDLLVENSTNCHCYDLVL